METVCIIEKWLFVFTNNILYLYLIIWVRQRFRTTAISVKGVQQFNLLYVFTYYILLPLMSALGFFQLTRWGNSNMLAIAVNMMFVMFWMNEIRKAAKMSYLHMKDKIVELVVLSKDKEQATFLLHDEFERVVWLETTKDIPLLKLFNETDDNCYLVKVINVHPQEENPLEIEFLTEDCLLKELEKIKKQRGSE